MSLRSFLAKHWARLAMGLSTLCFFRSAPSTHTFLFRRDAFRLYLPLQQFIAQELHAGRFPTWFPYDGAGTSLLGSSIAGLLNPLNLFLLALQPAQALKAEVLVAIVLGGLGAYRWAGIMGARREGRLLALIAYGLSGYLLSLSDNPPYLYSAATLPWVGWAAEELARRSNARSQATLGLALACTAWGGDLQGVTLQIMLVQLILLSHGRTGLRARLLAEARSLGLLLLLWSPTLPSIIAAALNSERRFGLHADMALEGAFRPIRLFELAFGPFYLQKDAQRPELQTLLGGEGLGGCWSASEFLGLLILALAVAGFVERRRRQEGRWYGALALIGVVLAMGREGGIYAWAFRHVPLWNAFRYPEKLMPYALGPICVLAALGAGGLGRARRAAGPALLGAALVSLGTLAASPRIALWAGVAATLAEEVTIQAQLHVFVGLVAAIAAMVLHLRFRSWAPLGVAALALGQALFANGWALPLKDSEWVERRSPLLEAVQSALRPGLDRLCWNAPAVANADHVAALGPVHPARWGIGSTRAYMPGEDGALTWICSREPRCGTPCARLLAGRVAIVDAASLAEGPGLALQERLRLAEPRVAFAEDPGARSFASLPTIRRVPTLAVAAERVAADTFDPKHEAIIVGAGPDDAAPGGEVEVSRPRPDTLLVKAYLDARGTVVIAEQCAQGWHAEVDGVPTSVERADLALCGIPVEAGEHHVELHYTPPGWPWVWLTYALGWLALVWLATRSRVS